MLRLVQYRNIRNIAWALTGAVLWLLPPGSSAAQASDIDLDLRAGVYSDASEAFVGGGVLGHLGRSRWYFNPNLEWVLVDRGDLYTVNADFHYDFDSQGDTDFWIGGGPALVFREPERGDGKTDAGLNLLAGIGFLRHHDLRPFIQGKLLLSDNTEAVLVFGLRLF